MPTRARVVYKRWPAPHAGSRALLLVLFKNPSVVRACMRNICVALQLWLSKLFQCICGATECDARMRVAHPFMEGGAEPVYAYTHMEVVVVVPKGTPGAPPTLLCCTSLHPTGVTVSRAPMTKFFERAPKHMRVQWRVRRGWVVFSKQLRARELRMAILAMCFANGTPYETSVMGGRAGELASGAAPRAPARANIRERARAQRAVIADVPCHFAREPDVVALAQRAPTQALCVDVGVYVIAAAGVTLPEEGLLSGARILPSDVLAILQTCKHPGLERVHVLGGAARTHTPTRVVVA